MSPALTQDMVDGMDDMAGLLPAHKPAARSSAFFWQDQPSEISAALRPQPMSRTVEARSRTFSIEERESSIKSTNKRAALIRGGI